MKMRTAAIVALVFCLLGLTLNLAHYGSTVLHLWFLRSFQSYLWPVLAVIHSVPVLALCVGVLTTESGRGR